MQTVAAALIAVINSLPSGAERVQLYRAVQDVTIAAKDTLTRMFARKHLLYPLGSKNRMPKRSPISYRAPMLANRSSTVRTISSTSCMALVLNPEASRTWK